MTPAAGFWRAWLRHGLPCAVVWTAYLLGFWPGILTDDSISQWRGMTTGPIGAYHSPLQTILYGLLTRVWTSPAILVLAQIVALSAAYAFVVAECAVRGAPRWLLAATTVAMATLPANGFLVITIWKDVPYTVSLLCVTALTLRLARHGGRFTGLRHVATLAIALTLAATFRFNGLATVALFVAVLIRAAPAARRQVWQVAALTLAGVVGIYGGLFRAFDVRWSHPGLADQTMLHQLGAAVRTGIALDRTDLDALAALKPLDLWASQYQCQTVIPTLGGVRRHSPDHAAYVAMRPALRVAWWHALTRGPGTMLRHQLCVAATIWNPLEEPYLASLAIVPNQYGLQTAPAVPALNRGLTTLFHATSRKPWRVLLWSPGADLLVVVGGVLWAMRRRVDRVTVAALSLPLLHSAVLFAAIPSAEYRLQYPVVVAALVTPLILVSALRSRPPEAV